jgi:hypothetical protein
MFPSDGRIKHVALSYKDTRYFSILVFLMPQKLWDKRKMDGLNRRHRRSTLKMLGLRSVAADGKSYPNTSYTCY